MVKTDQAQRKNILHGRGMARIHYESYKEPAISWTLEGGYNIKKLIMAKKNETLTLKCCLYIGGARDRIPNLQQTPIKKLNHLTLLILP